MSLSIEELADQLKFDIAAQNVDARHSTGSTKIGGAVGMEGIDPMLGWLSDEGHVVRDNHGDWVDCLTSALMGQASRIA
jgi:hypothetical protein